MEKLTDDVIESYRNSLIEHTENVQTAGRFLGVPERQLSIHDQSKWEMSEFLHYARQHKGPADDPDGYSVAWLPHIHCNPHHWQFWMFADGYSPKNTTIENGVVRMPDEYCLEMIADWLGASKAYTGSWDMTDWLFKNFGRVQLHSLSLGYVLGKLVDLGYYSILIEIGYPLVCVPETTIPFVEFGDA